MDNVNVSVKGNIATITVDLSQKGSPSSSGKTLLVASTHGTHPLANGVAFSLNAYVKNPAYSK